LGADDDGVASRKIERARGLKVYALKGNCILKTRIIDGGPCWRQ